VNIPAGRIDWDRTNRYADATRAARYAATQAEPDYVALSNAVARTLNDVAVTADPTQRLAIVEGARKTLAEWPQTHYGYRVAEVRQMLAMLDETIADLRAAAGGSRFALSLVAVASPPEPSERLLPAPTPVESIEHLLAAANLMESPAERESLLSVAIAGIDRDAASLPSDWAAATRAKAKSALDAELRVDRTYQAMIRRIMARADAGARLADVRGIRHVIESLRANDALLGQRRPDTVNAALAAVEARLDAARRLQLARDRWSVRAPLLRQYALAMAAIFRSLELPSTTSRSWPVRARPRWSWCSVSRSRGQVDGTDRAARRMSAAHALIVSAAHLADNAAGSAAMQRLPETSPVRGTPRPLRAPDARRESEDGHPIDHQSSPASVITPRRTRLVRVRDSPAFREAIAESIRHADPSGLVIALPGRPTVSPAARRAGR
jgi:hypothetical protein